MDPCIFYNFATDLAIFAGIVFDQRINLLIMEEGKDKIAISCGDILTLSQEISDRDVKYAKLEVRYEMAQDEIEKLRRQLNDSEAARIAAETENRALKTEIERQRGDIETLKARLSEIANDSRLSEQEMMEKTIAYLLESNIFLSIVKIQEFMQSHVSDVILAFQYRGFIEECVPDKIKPAVMGVISKLIMLPEKPKPQPTTIDNRTINMTGDHVTYEEKNQPNE